MPKTQPTTAYVYDIVGHNLKEGETVSPGIEQYTEELIQIRLDLEELERDVSSLSINRYGLDAEQELEHPIEAIKYLLLNLGKGVTEQDDLEEQEEELQELLERISNARDAMITGHVSRVESIDPSDFNSRLTQQEIREWVIDDTFPEQIEKLESAAERVDRRLTAKRETANARVSFTVSLMTVFLSLLLLGFAALSFIVSLISVANVLM